MGTVLNWRTSGSLIQSPARSISCPADTSSLLRIRVYFRKAVARDQSQRGLGGCQRRDQGPRVSVPADKGRKPAERWRQHVTPGPQAWAAAVAALGIMVPFVLHINSPEKKGFQGLLLLLAQCRLPGAPL